MSLVARHRDKPVAFAFSLEVTHDLPLTVEAVRRADRGTGDVNSVKASRRSTQPWLGPPAAVWYIPTMSPVLSIAKP